VATDGHTGDATSREACRRALRLAAARLDERPTTRSYADLGLTPGPKTIRLVYADDGGWDAALRDAGFDPAPRKEADPLLDDL